MTLKNFHIILLAVLPLFTAAQADSSFSLVKTIPVIAADFAVDHLNNLYILTKKDQLKKYNANGDSTGAYNDVRRFGKLASIDVTNPLKLLLYYRDFSTVVLLDRQLSARATIDLRRLNIVQASAIGLSYDNNIWLFDALENKLKKIDENGNLLFQTIDLRTVTEKAFMPEKIIDRDGSVYLYDPAAGILQFDYYGTLQKKIPLLQWKNVSVLGRMIAGVNEGGISLFHTTNYMERQYQFPSSFGSFSQYIIGNTHLFALGSDSVYIYTFRL